MSLRRNSYVITMLLAAGSFSLARAQAAVRTFNASGRATGTSVALASGSCTAVAPGDTVTFAWKPAFDHADTVEGLREVSLLFARSGEENATLRGHGGLRLKAVVLHGQTLGASTLTMRNNTLLASFRPELPTASANYYIVAADVSPAVAADYLGDLPRMTHDPSGAGFCITVQAAQE